MRAKDSNTYQYYKSPFITHSPPTYCSANWPLYLKRLNAALRNTSQWIALSNNRKIKLYKSEKCPLCNASDDYTIFHILTQCIMLTSYIKNTKKLCNVSNLPEDLFVLSFTNMTLKQLKEVHYLLLIHAAQVELTLF